MDGEILYEEYFEQMLMIQIFAKPYKELEQYFESLDNLIEILWDRYSQCHSYQSCLQLKLSSFSLLCKITREF